MTFEKVRAIICEELGVEESEVALSTRVVEDLEIDSLGMLDLDMLIEDEFGIRIEDLEGIKTVEDIVNYIDKNVK